MKDILARGSTPAIVTKPKNPLGPVSHCPCGRWNDAGRDPECLDCGRAVRGLSGFMGRNVHQDRQAFYQLEEETAREFREPLSTTAAYGLGLFKAHEVREAVGA